DFGKLPGEFFAALVVVVVERVDHRHGARQRALYRLRRVTAQERRVFHEYRPGPADLPHNGGHTGIVAVPDLHNFTLFKIDAVQVLDEGGDKMLASLFPITDDVDTGLLLLR